MANTANRGYPKPVSENFISDDVLLLMQAFDMIDGDVASILTLLGGKAATVHNHAMSDVTGLAAALAEKSAVGHSHKLDDLTDVSGADAAPDDYVLAKVGGSWVPVSKASLQVGHGHAISDVTNLQTALDGKLSAASLSGATQKATPVDADTLPLTDSEAGGALKKITFATIKSAIQTAMSSVFASLSGAAFSGAVSFAAAPTVSGVALLSQAGVTTVFTGNGTWTRDPRAKTVKVTAVGSGAGGGGSTTGTGGATGGGGGRGGTAIALLTAANAGASQAITVGALALGGAAGNNNGGAGNPSSFGTLVIAAGGDSGDGVPLGTLGTAPTAPAASTFSGTFILNYDAPAPIPVSPHLGRDSTHGIGGTLLSNQAGLPGSGYGSGGGGGNSTASGNNRAGGNGAPGLVIVEEFF